MAGSDQETSSALTTQHKAWQVQRILEAVIIAILCGVLAAASSVFVFSKLAAVQLDRLELTVGRNTSILADMRQDIVETKSGVAALKTELSYSAERVRETRSFADRLLEMMLSHERDRILHDAPPVPVR